MLNFISFIQVRIIAAFFVGLRSLSLFNNLINFSEPSSTFKFRSTKGNIPVSDKTENLPPISGLCSTILIFFFVENDLRILSLFSVIITIESKIL